MSFIDPAEVAALEQKISSDPSWLGKLYKSKSNKFMVQSVDHNLVDALLDEGWETYGKPLQSKTVLRKLKSHDQQFEDDVWCQMHKLGYRTLNVGRDLALPFGTEPTDKKQIDVLAIDDETILIIECKSSAERNRAPSFKTEMEALRLRLDGHKKALEQVFGKGRKVKFIFATRNLMLGPDSDDIKRLKEAGGYFYNDNTFDYVESLIRHYKDAARYQFLGMILKGQSINKERIEVPAIEGKMGSKKYYMFSIEPSLLLKIGFVLHRTRANEAEMPTYQRLLVPNRLKGITKFIDQGGYFPNSAIINFNEQDAKLDFQPHSRETASISRTGILKIPNSYAIAYIIDGQHRIYGYANSQYRDNNTIPVVAFADLSPSEQLELFMDINQNQKAVSPTLRITLEEDLYWNSNRLDTRLKALRSSIIRQLGGDQTGPLFGKVSLGEDKALLQAQPFIDALLKSSLLPKASGNQFDSSTAQFGLYDTANVGHETEMVAARKRALEFINRCYVLAEDVLPKEQLDTYILTNRGTFAFVSLIGSLHAYEAEKGNLSPTTPSQIRFECIEKYLLVFFKELQDLAPETHEKLADSYGQKAQNIWLRVFQSLVNLKFEDYNPIELQDWKERQNKELQDSGRAMGTQIEKHIKARVIGQLQHLFSDNWDLEIGSIKRECQKLADEEIEKRYKQGLGRQEIAWTDMFGLSQYKTIIEKYWTKSVQNSTEFETFEKHFGIDIGRGFNSKDEKLAWLSIFTSLRNNWAHEGTKEKGLNSTEVEQIRKIHDHFGLKKPD